MWTEQDASNLRTFYATETGKRFLDGIKSTEPSIDSSSIEKAAMTAQRLIAFKDIMQQIENARDFKQVQSDETKFIDVTGLDVKE